MFEIKNDSFYMDGKPFHIYSGAIHYFRVFPEYWKDRLLKLKAAGFNTVETYMPWNLHEPKPGCFDFSGMLDIENFLETAERLGIYAIVRPGPYICAEWDFGGLPAWLLKDKNMQIRCSYPGFIEAVDRYYAEIMPRLKAHLHANGGNIIAMQIENEYGSYGNDKNYLRHIKGLMPEEALLFTSDGNTKNMISGGSLPGVYKVLNFGSGSRKAFDLLNDFEHFGPNMCGEFWCGWFDFWRGPHHKRDPEEVVDEIRGFLEKDASFNIYMFHGGTNFAFTAGANQNPGKGYEPDVTSYDYCALLTEWGDYTPAYYAVRELLCEAQSIDMPPLLPRPQCQKIGKVKLDKSASFFDNLTILGKHYINAVPESMEYFDQNFGMIYYETYLNGNYPDSFLELKNVHDFAYLYIDDNLSLKVDRTLYSRKNDQKNGINLPAFSGSRKISVLVDTMGHVNYGSEMLDRKGISDIYLDIQRLTGFDIYTIPLDKLSELTFDDKERNEYPIFLSGHFKAESKSDTFVHLDSFSKGYVFVNGFNLGRYWNVGPQKSLYIPGPLLKEDNEIIILEMENCRSREVLISDKHDLG